MARKQKSITELRQEIEFLKRKKKFQEEKVKRKNLKREVNELKYGKAKRKAKKLYGTISHNIISNFG